MACQSLIGKQCDMALAGGVCVRVPQRSGYYHEPGGIFSPDGHCRVFDAKAKGVVFGNGVGVVVLKRLEEALADGDFIHAVVKGSAINNDGSAKASYAAPGLEGQVAVIRKAQEAAGAGPESITYVEAHGTGTVVGDPIEIEALTQAFRSGTGRTGYCGVGSVKTNFGHLDHAAGVAGFLKTVLALKHRAIPPSLHFERANPAIDFASTPFYVASTLAAWKRTRRQPRRAGVSAFGIGGTNAHVILEEAPRRRAGRQARSHQLLLLSARTKSALETATANLAAHLSSSRLNLADAAYTSQIGRRAFAHRRALVCDTTGGAAMALEGTDPKRVLTGRCKSSGRPIYFLFSGQGSQYARMAEGLYRGEPT
jgi:acyl transferase domain-containing protein